MESRVRFKDGEQREFLNLVIKKLNCVSLRGILQFGFDMPYSSLKNYYCERRLLPKSLFENLCYLIKIEPEAFDVRYLESSWGKIKGGKKSKRKKREGF
jgi:hypothetical protein